MRDLTIHVNDLTKIYGNATPLIVQLRDNDTPLANKRLKISIHGVDYNRTTGVDGRCSLNINLEPGSYPTKITFSGDSTYNPTTRDVVVRVIRNDTRQPQLKEADHYFEVNKLALKVIMNDGFSTKMGTNVKETDLLYNSQTMNVPTFFFNSGDSGIEFEVSVVIMPEYNYNGVSYRDSLDQWNKFLTPVSVVTDAFDVPNGKYIMTIKSKKQTDKKKTIWKLRFKQYYENNFSFENVYTELNTSRSAVDNELAKHQSIDAGSGYKTIISLQWKLLSLGCFSNTYRSSGPTPYGSLGDEARYPNGVWDSTMMWDIRNFQRLAGIVNGNGVCDRRTIIALLGYGE